MNQTILFLAVGGLLFTMDTGCSRARKASSKRVRPFGSR